MSNVEFFAVNAEPIKPRLKSKSRKYKKLVQQGYPYVIALYLEPVALSAEEVVEAWFGGTNYIVDVDTQKVVNKRLDGSGKHYYKNKILHKSITGTLAFRRTNKLKNRFINGWYVENPYACNPINTVLFPVESRFIVLGEDSYSHKMGWQNDNDDQWGIQ